MIKKNKKENVDSQRIKKIKKIKKKIVILILTFALFMAVFTFYGNTVVTVSEYDIRSEKIPPGFDGFRIVQISDLHNSNNTLMTDSLISKVDEAKPDIIFLTGDAIDSYSTDVLAAMRVIKAMNEIAPIYYVIGNHEARTGEYYSLSKAMHKISVTELNNSAVTVRLDDDEIVIAGINDPRLMNQFGGDYDSQLADSWLGSLEYDREMYTILLSHRPELISTYATHGIDLVFSGRAHGGLIRIPFVGGVFAPNQGLFPKYTFGRYTVSDTTMIVSRGVGNSGTSFRLNDNPEIVVVRLHAG